MNKYIYIEREGGEERGGKGESKKENKSMYNIYKMSKNICNPSI